MPASRHMSTSRVASSTCWLPECLYHSPPPKVIVPNVSRETSSPDPPKNAYSILPLCLQDIVEHTGLLLQRALLIQKPKVKERNFSLKRRENIVFYDIRGFAHTFKLLAVFTFTAYLKNGVFCSEVSLA